MATLRELRLARGLTQEYVASVMSISQARVSEIEHTEIGKLRISTIQRFLAALGLKLKIEVVFTDCTYRI